jgi:hypothetical protein
MTQEFTIAPAAGLGVKLQVRGHMRSPLMFVDVRTWVQGLLTNC